MVDGRQPRKLREPFCIIIRHSDFPILEMTTVRNFGFLELKFSTAMHFGGKFCISMPTMWYDTHQARRRQRWWAHRQWRHRRAEAVTARGRCWRHAGMTQRPGESPSPRTGCRPHSGAPRHVTCAPLTTCRTPRTSSSHQCPGLQKTLATCHLLHSTCTHIGAARTL